MQSEQMQESTRNQRRSRSPNQPMTTTPNQASTNPSGQQSTSSEQRAISVHAFALKCGAASGCARSGAVPAPLHGGSASVCGVVCAGWKPRRGALALTGVCRRGRCVWRGRVGVGAVGVGRRPVAARQQPVLSRSVSADVRRGSGSGVAGFGFIWAGAGVLAVSRPAIETPEAAALAGPVGT